MTTKPIYYIRRNDLGDRGELHVFPDTLAMSYVQEQTAL